MLLVIYLFYFGFMMVGNVIFKVELFEDELIYSFYYGGKGLTCRVKPSDRLYAKKSRFKNSTCRVKDVCRTFPKEDRRK